MFRKAIHAAATVLVLGSTALAPVSAMAGVPHGAAPHSLAKCGVNSIIPGGTLRGPGCPLR